MRTIIYFILLTLPLIAYGDKANKDYSYINEVASKYLELHSRGAMWTEEGKDEINDLTLEEEEYVGVHGGKSIIIINGYNIGKIVINEKEASAEVCWEIIGYYTYGGPADNFDEFEFKYKFKKEKTILHLVKYKKELFLHERENTWLVKTNLFPHTSWEKFIKNINIIKDMKNADKDILIEEVIVAKDKYKKTIEKTGSENNCF